MPQETIEILNGKETKKHLTFNPQELERLVDAWMEETNPPVEIPISEFRHLASYALRGTPIGDYIASKIIKERQRRERAEEKRELIDHLGDELNSQHMVIARMNGRAVGMVRVRKLYVVGSKVVYGDIFEIGKGITLPEIRGRGVYRQMSDLVIEQLRKWYGAVTILTGTKNETIKAMRRKDGWQEIGFEEYMRIWDYKEDDIASCRDDIQQKGWTAFLYTPQGNSSSVIASQRHVSPPEPPLTER